MRTTFTEVCAHGKDLYGPCWKCASDALRVANLGRHVEYEWGVQWRGKRAPHRWGMTEDEAREWVEDTARMTPSLAHAFHVIRREVGKWEEPDAIVG